jgi:hypothetical protein
MTLENEDDCDKEGMKTTERKERKGKNEDEENTKLRQERTP